jgi:hypothetical protein
MVGLVLQALPFKHVNSCCCRALGLASIIHTMMLLPPWARGARRRRRGTCFLEGLSTLRDGIMAGQNRAIGIISSPW